MSAGIAHWRQIYSPDAKTLFSEAFYIQAKQIGIIRAFGFQDYKSQTPGSFRADQVTCLQMLLFDENEFLKDLPATNPLSEPFIVDLSKIRGELVEAENVRINDCPVGMGKCDNLMYITTPGTYRFVMDDPAAMGVVRLYLNTFAMDDMVPNHKLDMGITV